MRVISQSTASMLTANYKKLPEYGVCDEIVTYFLGSSIDE